jgi:glutamate synthase (NADPH/NADH) small chain
MVISSVGRRVDSSFISSIPGLVIENGRVRINADSLQTDNQKFFAGGDCTNGGKEVVNAAADGKKAAHGIDRFLGGRT